MRVGDTERGTATDDWLDYQRLKPELPKPLPSISRTKSNQSGAILLNTHTQIRRDAHAPRDT